MSCAADKPCPRLMKHEPPLRADDPRWAHGPERWGTGSDPWYVEEPQQPPLDNTTAEDAPK